MRFTSQQHWFITS